jgi:hypothetical protein
VKKASFISAKLKFDLLLALKLKTKGISLKVQPFLYNLKAISDREIKPLE